MKEQDINTARDLILELYKDDHITKQEADILLDAINNTPGTTFIPAPYYTYIDWVYRPHEQPRWTITSNNTNSTDVE